MDVEIKVYNRCHLFFQLYWKTFLIVFVPIILLPIIILNNTEIFRCLYIICIINIFWITEALPVQITAMIPLVFFPFFDILETEKVTQLYITSPNMMFIGGIILAIAIESSKIHKRLALLAIKIIGINLIKLNFILMTITMLMSMWMSNMAATAIMCSICSGILDELQSKGLIKIFHNIENDDEIPRPTNLTLSVYVGIAYASLIGGVGTLFGSGTNIVLKGIYEHRFKEATHINFVRWSLYSIPIMFLACFLTFIWLQIFYFGFLRACSKEPQAHILPKESENVIRSIVETKLKMLGPILSREISIIFLFMLMVILLSTRSPGIFHGWGDYFTEKLVDDSVVMILIVLLIFIIPAEWKWLNYFQSLEPKIPITSSLSLLNWTNIHQKLPWGLILLIGAGFSIAEGVNKSNLSHWLQTKFIIFESFPPFILLIIICFLSAIITNFTANVAVSNIILPILSELAVAIKIHPLILMFTPAICCNFGFLLPFGTPSVTLISDLVHIRKKSLVIVGIVPTVIVVSLYAVIFMSYGHYIFNIDGLPKWAIFNETLNATHMN